MPPVTKTLTLDSVWHWFRFNDRYCINKDPRQFLPPGIFFQYRVSTLSALAQQTAVHDVESVVGLVSDAGVVSGHDQGTAALGAELKEKVQDFPPGLGIKVAGGFIGDQQRGMIDERARNGDTLLFPAESSEGRCSIRSSSPTRQSSCSASSMVSR